MISDVEHSFICLKDYLDYHVEKDSEETEDGNRETS